MNESKPSPGLSRRGFLRGTAGVAVAAALPLSGSVPALSRSTRAAVTPVAGASINLAAYGARNYVDAANTFDGYVGMPLAETIQKIYMGKGQFPDAPSTQMSQLSSVGCQFLVSIEPSRAMTKSEQSKLTAWLAMLKKAGITYRIVLYSECNNQAFKTADSWLEYWRYYAPVVQDAGVVCGYDPGCNYLAISRAIEYFPSDPAPDELWMDSYATAFKNGVRLEEVIETARSAGVSAAGMAEWGWTSGNPIFTPLSVPWWNDYCSYLIYLAEKEYLNLGGIFYGSKTKGLTVDVIKNANDPRIPMIQKVSEALQAG